jgi:hypothetical protein
MGIGVLGISECAGWDSQAEASRMFKVAFDEFSGHQSRGFTWLRSSDWAALPKRVLVSFSVAEGGTACVFGDINDRLSADARAVLDGLQPDKASETLEPTHL